MAFPWYLKPDLFLHAEMLDKQEALESAANSSYATDQRQDKEIQSLKKRVTELENQLLALEKILSEHGILPPCRPSRRLRRRTPPPASPPGPWRPWPVPGAAAASGATGISATPADCPSSMKTRNFKLFKARQTPGFIFLPFFGQPMENPHEKAATP